jgi:hypothetical protein
MINSCCNSLRAQVWRRGRFRSKTGALPIGGHHGIRNARQYGSPGFENLFRNRDVRGWQRTLQAISTVDQAGADELVKTSIDGGINFFDTADNYTQRSCQRHIVRKLITSVRRNPCLSFRTLIPGAPRCW